MKKLKRVLLLLRRLDCNDGVSSYCETLMRSLAASGCEVHVACGTVFSSSQTFGRYERMRGLAASWTDIGAAGLVPRPSVLRVVATIIRHNTIDVINVQGFGALLWGRLLSVLTRRPVVATYLPSAPGSLSDVLGADERPFDRRQQLFFNLFAPARVIALSAKNAADLIGQFPRMSTRVDTIYCGIDTDHFRIPTSEERAYARAALGLEERTLMCLSVGRLDWNKGHDVLIRAVRIATKTLDRPIRGFIVGSGHDEEEIRALAAEGPDDRRMLTVLGHVDDVRDVMWAADVIVLASRLEGFGLVVVEAMACGVAAVRTPSGGASDQIEPGVTGLIVPFEDPAALAEAFHTLSDDHRRNMIAHRAAERANAEFDKTIVTKKVLETFNRAVTRT